MNDILSKIGFTPEIEYAEVKTKEDSEAEGFSSYTYIDPATGEEVTSEMSSNLAQTVDGVLKIPFIKGSETEYTGGGAFDMEPPKERSGGKTKRPQKTAKSDVVKRYKEVDDNLSDVQDAMEDASRVADTLWGPSRIKKMRQVQDEMKKELNLLRSKKAEAEGYLVEDRENLLNTAKGFGITIEFDGNNISNYTTIMEALYKQLADAESKVKGEATEAQEKAIEDIEYKIEQIQKAIDLYDETKDILRDIDNEIEEQIIKLQQEKLDEINLELEIDLVVNETQLKELEYYLSKLEDNFFGMAEALALMIGNNENGFNQLSTYQDSLIDYQEQYARLLSNYTTIDPATGATYIN
jgi:hypothetical protein